MRLFDGYVPKPAVTREVGKSVDRFLICYVSVGAVLALVAHALSTQGIHFGEIRILAILAQVTPAIDAWTSVAQHKNVAMALWLYITYSFPFCFFAVYKRFGRLTIHSHSVFWVVFIPCSIAAYAILFWGMGATPERLVHGDSRHLNAFSRDALFCTFFSLCIGVSALGTSVFTARYFLQVFQGFWQRDE